MRIRTVGVRLGALGAFAIAIATPGRARALDAEVTSDTAAQFYDVRSPTGETILARRRVMTTLGVSAYDIIDRPMGNPAAPELMFRARMRYDADYGASGAEVDKGGFNTLVPGFSRGPVDLMYGYVEGRKFLGGWLGFKLGRQYVTDALGWYSFDGGEVRITTPFYVQLEGYGGLEVRGGMPLSTSRFERDGVWRGDRSGYDPALYPSFQPNAIAPVVGAAIESAGVTWLHGRLTYRRVTNTGDTAISSFASGLTTPAIYGGTRISQERIGYSLDATLAQLGGLKGGLSYDLYLAKFASFYGSLDAFVSKKLTMSLDYDYFQPTFDGDSIWNFFASEPTHDIALRGTYLATEKLSVSAGAHVRLYMLQTKQYTPNASPNIEVLDQNYYRSSALASDEGGNLAARYKWGDGVLGARGNGNFGNGGDRIGADVYAEKTLETRFLLEARASVWQWYDKLRPDRDAVSLGYVAGVGYRFAPRAQTLFEFEHNMNRLVGQRLRAMLWLTLAVSK
jgi:hypothetical protein